MKYIKKLYTFFVSKAVSISVHMIFNSSRSFSVRISRWILSKLRPVLSTIDKDQDILSSIEFMGVTTLMLCNRRSVVENEIIKNRVFDVHMLKCIYRHIRRDSIFLDIGANIGSMSIPIANMFKDEGVTVIACDPCDTIYKRLVSNIEINKLTNIKPVETVITNYTGITDFYSQQGDAWNMGLSSINNNNDIVDGELVASPCITVDKMISDLELNQSVSVIKVDVQGAELEVLKGAERTLTSSSPVLIFEHEDEYHNNPIEIKTEIKNYLEGLGYKMFLFHKDLGMAKHPEVNFGNYLNADIIAVKL
jgi:FkbM family methyltransferase